ncbi:MAG: glycosyltransferase family 4 protein [Terriglobia bacterium]
MRILHIDTGAGWRGGQQQVLWLMEALRERGFDQVLLAPADSPLAARVRSTGLPVKELTRRAISLRNVLLVRKSCAEADVLHAHDSHAHTLAALAAFRMFGRHCAVVVSRRVAFPAGRFGRIQYAFADAYIAVSEFAGRQLLDVGVPARKIHVIWDGVPAGTCRPTAEERAAFRARHGMHPETPLVGTLTSLAPEKSPGSLVALLAELPPTTQFWLARPAAEESPEIERALQQAAQARGLEGRFRILSPSEDAGPFLAALDVFVYLSNSEGLGSAILLAMAHGLPVVASRVGGIPEIVRDGETGLLIAPNRRQDLVSAVQGLLESEPRRRLLGQAARAFVLDHATCDRMAAQTAAVYEELLQGKPVSEPSRPAG